MNDEILKGACFHCEEVALMNVKLKEENARLREALEFYASQDSWTEIVNRNNIYGTILGDFYRCEHEGARFGGKTAREALERSEE